MFIEKEGSIFRVEQTENYRIEVAVNEFHIQLETDKTKILADGLDKATVKAKVFNYENNYQVGFSDEIYFRIAGEVLVVKAVNGQAQIEIQAEIKETILLEVSAVGIEGAVLNLEAY